MDVRITAYGVAGIGWVCGYILLFALRRCLPPIAGKLVNLQEVVLLVVTLAGGSFLGTQFISLDGVNYIGPYGIGLFAGVITNLIITQATELLFHWIPQILGWLLSGNDNGDSEPITEIQGQENFRSSAVLRDGRSTEN